MKWIKVDSGAWVNLDHILSVYPYKSSVRLCPLIGQDVFVIETTDEATANKLVEAIVRKDKGLVNAFGIENV